MERSRPSRYASYFAVTLSSATGLSASPSASLGSPRLENLPDLPSFFSVIQIRNMIAYLTITKRRIAAAKIPIM